MIELLYDLLLDKLGFFSKSIAMLFQNACIVCKIETYICYPLSIFIMLLGAC
jgi:hypothetical protein